MRHEADVDDDELMTWNDERGMGKKMEDDEDQQRQNHHGASHRTSRVFGHRVAASLHSV